MCPLKIFFTVDVTLSSLNDHDLVESSVDDKGDRQFQISNPILVFAAIKERNKRDL